MWYYNVAGREQGLNLKEDKKMTRAEVRKGIANLTEQVLTDNEIMTEKVREQIKKALNINSHLTSCYSLQVAEVQDIKGKDSRTSGWYFILEGTRCGVKFFLNNEMEIVRKPNKNTCEVKATYSLYNDNKFHEGFWMNNF